MQWLQAFITPVLKKVSHQILVIIDLSHLLVHCCRVMERIINTQLIDHLLVHQLITPHQHGLQRKLFTCSDLLETINDWCLALNYHLVTDAVY